MKTQKEIEDKNDFSFSGTVKVWTLNGQEDKSSQILENESKQIRCLNALSLTCCAYNMRTVLIVCNTYWNVYDAGDFTCLLSVPCQRGERWLGGEFISGDKLCCWSDSGDAYLYKLPTNCIVESKDFHNRSREGQAGKLNSSVDRSEAEMGMIYYRVITYKVNMNERVVEHCTKLQNFPQNLRST